MGPRGFPAACWLWSGSARRATSTSVQRVSRRWWRAGGRGRRRKQRNRSRSACPRRPVTSSAPTDSRSPVRCLPPLEVSYVVQLRPPSTLSSWLSHGSRGQRDGVCFGDRPGSISGSPDRRRSGPGAVLAIARARVLSRLVPRARQPPPEVFRVARDSGFRAGCRCRGTPLVHPRQRQSFPRPCRPACVCRARRLSALLRTGQRELRRRNHRTRPRCRRAAPLVVLALGAHHPGDRSLHRRGERAPGAAEPQRAGAVSSLAALRVAPSTQPTAGAADEGSIGCAAYTPPPMLANRLTPRARRILRADLWVTIGPTVLIIAAAFGVTMLFVKPAPPKRLTAAIAPDEGGSKYYARRYQEILKRQGITLEVRQTGGSLTNVQLLADPGSGVAVAFVQSGTEPGERADHIVSLGSLAYVPLWVFHRGDPIDDVRELKGRRIAVGGPESGTRALAATVLGATGADQGGTELLPLEREAAIEQLKGGEIDAAFLVAPAESPDIKKLAAAPGVRLLSFARADAYVRRYPYLSKLVLPRGVFDLA